jgi:transcriptional regulator with XRE-family HTH domain
MNRDKEKIQNVQDRIAKKLIKHRRALGYPSHEKFSGLNDMSRSSYEGYEHGANMNLDTFIHILGALGLSFSEFLEEIDEATKTLYPDRFTEKDIRKIYPPKG